MKQCQTCKQEKPLSAFGNNKSRLDGHQNFCRDCGKAKDRKHYIEGRDRKARIKAASARTSQANRQFINNYKASQGCMDCDELDPIVMEFDHVRGTKKYNVSNMMRSGISLETIKQEIAKCDVVCANCHRKRTAARGNYHSDIVKAIHGRGHVEIKLA